MARLVKRRMKVSGHVERMMAYDVCTMIRGGGGGRGGGGRFQVALPLQEGHKESRLEDDI